jgi:hypothetical protein
MRNNNSQKATPSQKFSSPWLFGILGALAAGLVLLGVVLSRPAGRLVPATVPDSTAAAEEESYRLRMEASEALFAKTRHIKGDPAAPVAIIEFSDFQ